MFWASGSLTALWDENRELKGFAKLVHDDTPKKQAEMERARILFVERTAKEETERAFTLLNAIFETAPVGIAFFDADLHYVRVNRALAEISGVSAEAHIGRSIRDVRPDIWKDLQNIVSKVIDDGQPCLNHVKDNGIGFEPQYADQIFEMFKRLHSRMEYPGTGLGLSVAKKIVEHHGGRIWAKSEPNEGSIFYFSLPLAEKKKDAA